MTPHPHAPFDPYRTLGGPGAAPGKRDNVTLLTVLAIFFGGLGVLCNGFGTVFGLLQLAGVKLLSGPAGQVQITPALKRFGVLDAVLELALYVTLLAIGIGARSRKPWARRAAVSWWSLGMITWATVRFILKLLWIGPASLEAIRQLQQSTPGAAAHPMPTNINAAMVGGAVFAFLVQLLLPVLFLATWRSPKAVRAFEGNGTPD